MRKYDAAIHKKTLVRSVTDDACNENTLAVPKAAGEAKYGILFTAECITHHKASDFHWCGYRATQMQRIKLLLPVPKVERIGCTHYSQGRERKKRGRCQHAQMRPRTTLAHANPIVLRRE